MQEKQKTEPFIDFLIKLRDNPDEGEGRAALATLRRGLTQPPGDDKAMYRYVVPFLKTKPDQWYDHTCFLIASLFAFHPSEEGQNETQGNMGDHSFKALQQEQTKNPQQKGESIERRFTALLSAHPDDLADYLRQAVGFLRSREIPINWHRLFSDVLNWNHESGYVQKEWARRFWQRSNKETEQAQTSNQSK